MEAINSTQGKRRLADPIAEVGLCDRFKKFDFSIVKFPHCIFEPSANRLRMVSEVTNCKVGLFGGIAPYYGLGGALYLPNDEGVTEDFGLWEVPKNQDRIYDWYICGADNSPMLIDTRTSRKLLARLNAIGSFDGSYPYEVYIEAIGKFIEELRWAYIPLRPEPILAMFVTSSTHAEWVNQLSKRIGPSAFSLPCDKRCQSPSVR